MEVADAFTRLMESDVWLRAGAAAAGYMAPDVLENLASGVVPDVADHPETYGVAVMGGAYFSPAYQAEMTLGAGVNTVESLAERTGIKSTIVNVGA